MAENPIELLLTKLTELGRNPARNGTGWKALCPAHDDHDPSLSIAEGAGGRALFVCRAGCSQERVRSTLGLSWAQLSGGTESSGPGKLVARYNYEKPDLWPEFDQKERYQSPSGKKTFQWKHYTKDGNLIRKRGWEPILYLLPAVTNAIAAGRTIWLAEGEKCVEALAGLGLTATTTPDGAGKSLDNLRGPLSALAGAARVCILPDNDPPGKKHAAQCASILQNIGVPDVRLIELPELPAKGDVCDWFAVGKALHDLIVEAKATDPLAPGSATVMLAALSGEELTDENLTDTGNSRRFVRHFSERIRYALDRERWLIWNGTRWAWASSQGKEILDLGKQMSQLTRQEAEKLPDEDRRKLIKYAVTSESARGINAMSALAAADPRIYIRETALDSDPWVFNVLNGTVDLREGKLRPHQREDFITQIAPVHFDPRANCPIWDQTLLECSGGRQDWVDYLERCFGYALTGIAREQCFFVNHGRGANGKDTVLLTVQKIMGDYARVTPAGLFEARRYDAHPTELAGLKGRRLVVASEFPEGRALNEARIKALTGENEVSARRMHEDFSDFPPDFKVFLACNHLPKITSTDDGIRRRPRMIPWDVQFTGEQVDRNRKEKLRQEWPGILARLVWRCLQWQKMGALGEPPSVVKATKDYLEEMDPVGRFVSDCCNVSSMWSVTKRELFEAYASWAKDNGAEELSIKALGMRLKERGIEESRTGKARSWNGLALKRSDEPFLDQDVTDDHS